MLIKLIWNFLENSLLKVIGKGIVGDVLENIIFLWFW